jgi:hypothetical protein
VDRSCHPLWSSRHPHTPGRGEVVIFNRSHYEDVLVTAPGIAAIAAIIVINRHDLVHKAIVVALLLGVMVINLLVVWNTETILKRGFAGVLPVIGWVLAVLQASLAVQIVIYSLRVLEVLHWPAS